VAAHADARCLPLSYEMESLISGWPEATTDRLAGDHLALVVDLVGKAEGLEGTANALGVVDQGQWPGALGAGLGCVEGGEGLAEENVIHGDLETQLLGAIIENGPVHSIASFSQQKGLQPHLDTVSRPGLGSGERAFIVGR